MFDNLSGALQQVFKKLKGRGKLTEVNIKEALREVRLALLEADVHFKVAKDFINQVRERCLGADVLDSITPGQQVVKHVNDELVELLGRESSGFEFGGRPAIVMLLGLHGSGKTTTAGKLAARWKGEGKNVLLAAADIRRVAAVEQLQTLGRQVGIDVVAPGDGESVPALGRRALEQATDEARDVLIVDTGGRFQIDAELVAELKELQDGLQAGNRVLVLDAAIGQESVSVAETFHQEVGLTGLILTKIDGDARGGAALSVHAVTGCPILLLGTGERMEDLEIFHPDRMASRILGMGDIVSLVEKAEAHVDADQMARMEKRMKTMTFDLEDFLAQMQQMKKMGPMDKLLEMMPGGDQMAGKMLGGASAEELNQSTAQTEAIIFSMTREERRKPKLISASRKRRIARGSGTEVSDVNSLLRQFEQARKMMKKLSGMQKRLPKFMR